MLWVLLVLAVLLVAPSPAAADPQYSGPVLYGFDPFLRTTRNPRLLGVDRLVLRERLLGQGVDPYKRAISPSFATAARYWTERRMNVKLDPETEITEANGFTGLYTRIRYPEWYFLVPATRSLPDGFDYSPPRRLDAPEVEVYVDDLDQVRQRNLLVESRLALQKKLDVTGGGAGGRDEGLINFTIPIKLPRTLESIIGRGEKTQIRISGREHIAIRGETTRSSNFVATEQVRGQSWFPDLNMEQQLQVKLDGQIGEKIFIEVEHDSEAIGPEGTKIKLAYRGDEDEIIQSIETGDVGLTLPGGQLLGYSSNQSGLFGIKVTGQLGPAAFTVVASKQKAESDSKNFNSSGGQQTPHPVYSWNYLNNRFFRLDLPSTFLGIPGEVLGYRHADSPGRDTQSGWKIKTESIRIYRNMGGIQPLATDVQYVAAAIDSSGRWDPAYVAALSADVNNWVQAWVWRPIDFTLLTTPRATSWPSAWARMAVDDILAVTYDVVDGAGNRVYRVGDQRGRSGWPDHQRDPLLPDEAAQAVGPRLLHIPVRAAQHLLPRRLEHRAGQLRDDARDHGARRPARAARRFRLHLHERVRPRRRERAGHRRGRRPGRQAPRHHVRPRQRAAEVPARHAVPVRAARFGLVPGERREGLSAGWRLHLPMGRHAAEERPYARDLRP
ncbi:MAG: hypothetical protein R3D98_09075 [Candidatus Krumholzibacteriia bacterium]